MELNYTKFFTTWHPHFILCLHVKQIKCFAEERRVEETIDVYIVNVFDALDAIGLDYARN